MKATPISPTDRCSNATCPNKPHEGRFVPLVWQTDQNIGNGSGILFLGLCGPCSAVMEGLLDPSEGTLVAGVAALDRQIARVEADMIAATRSNRAYLESKLNTLKQARAFFPRAEPAVASVVSDSGLTADPYRWCVRDADGTFLGIIESRDGRYMARPSGRLQVWSATFDLALTAFKNLGESGGLE